MIGEMIKIKIFYINLCMSKIKRKAYEDVTDY